MTSIVGQRIDPLDHFTRPEWAAVLRKARVTNPRVRNRSEYGIEEFRAILTAAEVAKSGW